MEAENDPYGLVDVLRSFAVETDRFVARFGSGRGLHRTDLQALAVLMQADEGGAPLSPGALGAALRLSSPATTALLDRLEASGHVARERSATDRRRIDLRVSPQAHRVGAELFGPLADTITAVASRRSLADQALLARFLSDLVTAMRDHTDG